MTSRLILISAIGGLTLIGGSALAQSVDWSGPYIGVNGGYNFVQTRDRGSTTVNQLGVGAARPGPTTFPTARDMGGSGWMAGGQIGYNIQRGSLVLGAEGDFDGVWANRNRPDVHSLPPTAVTTGSALVVHTTADPSWIATVRGRVGFAFERALFYGAGGVAFADLHNRASYAYSPSVTPAVAAANPGASFGPYRSSGSSSGVHVGWTAGAGVEFMTTRNITIGAEYRHTDIGGRNVAYGSSGPNGTSESFRSHFTDDAVLARVNFKFSNLGMF